MKRTGIIATILALMLVLIGSASATITDITLTPLTATEDTAYTGSATATSDKTITKYEITTGPAWLTITEASGALSGTPLAAHIGNNAVTVKATDADGSMTKSFTIAVAATNDAPVVSVSDCATKTQGVEDVAYICTVSATDEEGNGITLTSSKGTITGTTLKWTPTEDEIGSNTVTVTATDNGVPSKEGSASFQVFVRPQNVCEDYTGGTDLRVEDIDITDDDEDFYPGSSIEMEISVENNADEDLDDVVVKAILYDTTDGKTLESVETDEFGIDEDESESVELTLDVPASLKIGHDIVLFITAYEGGNDDENCDWEYNNDLDFAIKAHDVSITDMVLTPETAKPGQAVELEVDVENVGDNDEEDVYIRVKNSGLLVDKKSEVFSIDDYEIGDDDEYTTTLTFTVPTGAKAGEYDLEVYVYNEDGKRFGSGFKTVKLTVESSGTTTTTTTTTGTATITVEGLSETVETGKPFSIPVKVTNTASTDKEYKIILTNIADWAESTSVIDAYLTPGQTSTYYLTLVPKTDATEGQHSATVNVKEGTTTVTTKTLSFTTPEKTDSITGGTVIEVEDKGAFQNIFSGTTFWIIGDLVLVIVGIFFIRMLFTKKEEQ